MNVLHVNDFSVSGDGAHDAWERAAWQPLRRVGHGESLYRTEAKMLYSSTGLYVLYRSEDRKLSCTLRQDFDNIFLEDVLELFLWPDTTQRTYFEYELSPLGVELPILVVNNGDVFMGWQPWKYADNRVQKATRICGGEKACGAAVSGWTAEFYIPFVLLRGMGNCPPAKGSTWRANLYRIDYDATVPSHWAWCPDTDADFHDYKRFGTLKFC